MNIKNILSEKFPYDNAICVLTKVNFDYLILTSKLKLEKSCKQFIIQLLTPLINNWTFILNNIRINYLHIFIKILKYNKHKKLILNFSKKTITIL